MVSGLQPDGLPHSDTAGSIRVCQSPALFAAYRVLLRLPKPRNPPYALASLSLVNLLLIREIVSTLIISNLLIQLICITLYLVVISQYCQ